MGNAARIPDPHPSGRGGEMNRKPGGTRHAGAVAGEAQGRIWGPAGIALLYAAFGLAWIFGSSLLLRHLVEDGELMARIELLKGGVYVLVTAGIFAWLWGRADRARDAELRQREAEQLNYHIGNSPLAVVEWDSDSGVRRWCGQAQAMFGWTEEEVLGKRPEEWPFVHPEDAEAVRSVMARLLDGSEARNLSRNRNLTRDGQLRHCEWYNSARLGPGGKVESVLSLVHNVTSERRFGLALAASEARYRRLFENNHAAMLVLDPTDGRIVDANPAAERFYGWARSELLAKRIGDILAVAPDEVETTTRVACEPRSEALHTRHRRASGKVADVEMHCSEVEDQGRSLLYSIIHDVTDRHAAQAALRESERKFRTLVELAPDAIFVQVNGRFVYLNARASELFGAGCGSELLGQKVIDRVHPAYREEVLARIKGLREERSVRPSFEEVWLRLDGEEVAVEVLGVPIRFGGRDGALVLARDISQRKAIEQQLDDNARLIGMAAAVAHVGGWAVDLKTQRTYWSDEVCRIYDLPPGSTVSFEEGIEFYLPEWRPKLVRAFTACVNEGVPFDEEFEILTATGRRVWVRTIGVAVREPEGEIVRLQGAFQDITQRKRAEAELSLQNRRAHALLELPRFADQLEEAELLRRCQAFIEDLTGSGISFIQFVDEDEGTIALSSGVPAPASPSEGPSGEADGFPPGWSTSNHRATVPVREMGRVVMLVGAGDKPTPYTPGDLETMELLANSLWRLRQGRRSLARLRQLSQAIEQSPESIVITDLEPRIQYVNAAFCANTGYSREEVLGRNPRILQSGKTPRVHYDEMWEALTSGRSWKGDFFNRRKDGTEYIEFGHVAPLREADGRVTHYVAVKEDITEKRALGRELTAHRAHLEELVAQRTAELRDARAVAEAANEAKSSFLANMSHEIRTPMNGVLGMIEVLARSGLSAEQADMVETIRESGKALTGVIEDILDFSKIEAGRVELDRSTVQIRSVVEGLCDSLVSVAAASDVQLSLYIAPEVPEAVYSDEVRLRQVLYNLLGNGIKFSRGRPERPGRVRLRVGVEATDPLELVFSVEDNGIGMSDETLGRLFTAFAQGEVSTTRRFGGTGLGLMICKRLVDLMSGSIEVSSALGEGSTFRVRVPVELAPSVQPPPLPDVGGLDCLLVESAEYDMTPLANYLEEGGAVVHRRSELQGARRDAVERGPGSVVVWYSETPLEGEPAPTQPYVRIERSTAPGIRLDGNHGVLIGRSEQRRRVLLQAVAVAAGRASPEHPPQIPGTLDGEVAPLALTPSRKILVAEDEAISRKVITMQLALLGCQADLAGNGREALSMWEAGDYALLLTDLHMPEMDGYMLSRAIRTREAEVDAGGGPRFPVIALTANALRGEADRAMAAGMDEYLTKPLTLTRLRETLSRFLETAEEEDLPVFDPRGLERLVGGDLETQRGLMEDYLDLADDEYSATEQAMAAGDAPAVAASTHKLKSSSRSVGAMALGDLCAQIEALAMANDVEALRGLAPRLASARASAETRIRARIRSLGTREDGAERDADAGLRGRGGPSQRAGAGAGAGAGTSDTLT